MTKTESVIQKEGSAHHEETETVEKQMASEPKLKSKVTPEQVKQTPNNTTETRKPKRQKKEKPATTSAPQYPLNTRINDYQFLHFKTAWLEDLGWTKGMALKLDKNPDASITPRKA
jgi:hypothetical protein